MEITIVLLTIIFLIITLYKEWLSPGLTFMVAIVLLLISDVISPKEALEGFANKQLAIIIFLLILSNVFKRASTLTILMDSFFKNSDSPKVFLFKMMSSVGLSSAFFNNTPLVAMMIPYVNKWSKENGQSPAKFLLPLSYASILGGCLTVIGTSTLLIVSGMAEESGFSPIGLFEVTPVGFIMFVLGIIFMMLFSSKLLPNAKQSLANSKQHTSRLFFFEMRIKESASIAGKTVQDAGLRNLKELFLVELNRGSQVVRAVSSNQILKEGDVLFFAGKASAIDSLNLDEYGLSWPQETSASKAQKNDLIEVVISHRSTLSGLEVRDTDFRARFDAAVLAIHRNGERIWGHLGQVVLKSGDVLLLMSGKDCQKRIDGAQDFYVISHTTKPKDADTKKVFGVFIGMILAIVLHGFGLVSLFKSLLLLLVITVLTKITSVKDVKSAIDYNLILIIGLGLALGKAMENSGAGEMIALQITTIASGSGVITFLSVLFFVTAFLSSIITSKAAVAVIFPVSISVAQSLHVDVMPFILVVAFAGAANFITPIGYQTNMMVYGPGGYKFKDFVKVGTPITLMYWLVTIITLSIWYDLI